MNKIFLYILFATLLATYSCTPRSTGVLRSPDVPAGTVGRPADEREVDDEVVERDEAKEPKSISQNIALLLPFQLNKMSTSALSEADVKRSALALDFYQGFQLGLEKISRKEGHLDLHVLDSRDDPGQSTLLARSEDVNNASLVVGPIYPQEIKSFGSNFQNKHVLQVNPLAATMPTEFNLPNLVSITPPISVHMRAISAQVEESYRRGDIIIVYNTSNADHRRFISGFLGDIRERLPEADIVSVSTVSQLNEQLLLGQTNHIVTGTTDRAQIRELIDNIDDRYMNADYRFNLYGHPLWDRLDFSAFRSFSSFNPVITSETHFYAFSAEVRQFEESYKTRFGVPASDHAYKGYDAGVYFAYLLDKYGEDYAEHIVDEPFKGIYSTYKFNKNDRWGYVNFGLTLKTYRAGTFSAR